MQQTGDVRATFSLQRRAGADLRGKGRVKIEGAAVENIWVQIVRFRNLRPVLLLLHHLHKKGSESAQSKRRTRLRCRARQRTAWHLSIASLSVVGVHGHLRACGYEWSSQASRGEKEEELNIYIYI